METLKARHDPPTVFSSGNEEDGDVNSASFSPGSSRKRAKPSHLNVLQQYAAKQDEKNEALIAEIRKAKEGRAKVCSALERLIENL